jgi:hypothetical protein
MIDGLKAAWSLVGHKLKNHGYYIFLSFCMMMQGIMIPIYYNIIRATPSRGKVLYPYNR